MGIEERERKAVHADGLQAKVEERLDKGLEKKYEQREDSAGGDDALAEPQLLTAMSDWKGAKDEQLSDFLRYAVKRGELYKSEGNERFTEGSYLAAFNSYKKGFDLFQNCSKEMYDAETKKLLVTLHSNAAQALLKIPTEEAKGANADGALCMAEHALKIDPTNLKARFRRGCAHANLEDWNLAREDFEYVLRLDPTNAGARRELQNLRAKRAAEKKKTEKAETRREMKDSFGSEKVEAAARDSCSPSSSELSPP